MKGFRDSDINTDLPELNLFRAPRGEITRRRSGVRPSYFRRVWNNIDADSVTGFLVMLVLLVLFLGFCYGLATGDFPDPNACSGQRVSGWSHGHYVNLCIENSR